VKKVVLLVSGASAVATMVVMGSGHAGADVPDVTGETYGKAVAILKAQGVKPVFGGSIGSDLPQSQCTVAQQSVMPPYKIKLMLDCTLPAGADKPQAPGTHSLVPPGGSVPGGARPTPGAGTVTVTPVPIG
jgi:PASTA domain